MLIRIIAPHFVAGVIVGDRAAPIIRYMARMSAPQIAAYCIRKGWRWEFVNELDTPQ